MDVKIRMTNKDQILRLFTDEAGFSVPIITMNALNRTVDQVKQALVDEMSKTFDRPTPYTLNAPYVRYANKTNLTAMVLLRDYGGKGRSEKYLLTQVYGGSRKLKSFESALRNIGVLPDGMYAVPGQRAPLNAYGNINPGFIVQILSYFRAFGEQGYRANISDEKKAKMAKGTKKKRGMEYFVIRQPQSGLKQPGIYRKTSGDFREGIGKTEPMIMFVKPPAYRQLLKWDEIAERVVNQNWAKNFKEASPNVVNYWGKDRP
jgi:hypothetical protein